MQVSLRAHRELRSLGRKGRKIRQIVVDSNAVFEDPLLTLACVMTDYEDPGPEEQAVARAQWQWGIADATEGFGLTAEFRAQGRSWTEADEDGSPVLRS